MVEISSETIQKYSKYSTAKLKLKAQKVFNAWIRKRDEGQPCINCGKYRTLQAGHYFAAGKYSSVRFNEDNVHGECVSCNYFNSQSHAQGYRTNLIAKIGINSFERLEKIAMYHRTTKDDRLLFIQIIEEYTIKIKSK